MAYDRADWHYGGDFPGGLPPECGATHIGMFLGWAIKRELVGELHREQNAEAIAGVRSGSISGRDFLLEQCDEKFAEEDLNEEGYRFAKSYFESRYLHDYDTCLGAGLDSLYHVEDSPANHDKIEALLDERFAAWRAAGVRARELRAARESSATSKPWWRFW